MRKMWPLSDGSNDDFISPTSSRDKESMKNIFPAFEYLFDEDTTHEAGVISVNDNLK